MGVLPNLGRFNSAQSYVRGKKIWPYESWSFIRAAQAVRLDRVRSGDDKTIEHVCPLSVRLVLDSDKSLIRLL